MKQLYTEIEMDAPIERVWHLLTDFEHMPSWNPFIPEIQGVAQEGAELKVHLRPPGGRGMTFRPTVLKAEPNRQLRWLGKLLVTGLFDGEHIFELEPLSDQRTRFVQREKFRGLLVPLLAGSLEKGTKDGFVAMNQALKAVAEQS
jgi:hypothetical protein